MDIIELIEEYGDSCRWIGCYHAEGDDVAKKSASEEATALLDQIKERLAWTDGIKKVVSERFRQIQIEGWSKDHDSQHYPSELALAGMLYVSDAIKNMEAIENGLCTFKNNAPENWPWSERWWKPTPNTPSRQLEKAAALLIAAIDRFIDFTGPLPEPPKEGK
ncbi:MAG: hypothetical protein SVO01_00065 [Thermotogota bacterium]|nr:hypothetical protein [Thermotogota bacterium]